MDIIRYYLIPYKCVQIIWIRNTWFNIIVSKKLKNPQKNKYIKKWEYERTVYENL